MILKVAIFLFFAGLWGVSAKRNPIKKVIGLDIITSAVVLFFIGTGYKQGATAPIMVGGVFPVVDPLPQALMLTTIVIGACVKALALGLIVRMRGGLRGEDSKRGK